MSGDEGIVSDDLPAKSGGDISEETNPVPGEQTDTVSETDHPDELIEVLAPYLAEIAAIETEISSLESLKEEYQEVSLGVKISLLNRETK